MYILYFIDDIWHHYHYVIYIRLHCLHYTFYNVVIWIMIFKWTKSNKIPSSVDFHLPVFRGFLGSMNMFKKKYKSHTVGRTEGELLAQVTAAQWRPLHKCSSASSLTADDQVPAPPGPPAQPSGSRSSRSNYTYAPQRLEFMRQLSALKTDIKTIWFTTFKHTLVNTYHLSW